MTHAVQISIPYQSSFPSDVCTNTLHFDFLGGGDPTTSELQTLRDDIKSFYQSVYTTVSGISMADYANPGGVRMKMYDLTDPKPRVPVLDEVVPLTVTQDTTSDLPPEVAIVLTYYTEFVSGANRQSQRGRVYLGCIGRGGITAGSGGTFPRLESTLRVALGNKMKSLGAAVLGHEWGHVVYSEKLNQSFAVAGGYVDNAFDTQRRRGVAPTARSVWTD